LSLNFLAPGSAERTSLFPTVLPKLLELSLTVFGWVVCPDSIAVARKKIFPAGFYVHIYPQGLRVGKEYYSRRYYHHKEK
jgi:hypothetical protein